MWSPRTKADEAYLVGKGLAPVAAYLDVPGIVRIAQVSRLPGRHRILNQLLAWAFASLICQFLTPVPRSTMLTPSTLATASSPSAQTLLMPVLRCRCSLARKHHHTVVTGPYFYRFRFRF